MTPYERGYAAGLKAAAALVPTDDTRELCCNGYDCECRKPEDAAFVAAEIEARRVKKAILSLPIQGEATNPGEQVPDSARIGGSHITSSPDSQGPSQECVSVPLPDFDSLVNIASPSPCVAVDGYCVECGASLPLDESCWKLAAAKEEHDAHR